MTIAVCSVTTEGVVLGADSTTSVLGPNGFHYLNFSQKVFEVGENSTLGMVTWGLAGLNKSYRVLLAELSDGFAALPPQSVEQVAARWAALYWAEFTRDLATPIQRLRDLEALKTKNAKEEEEFKTLNRGLFAGFFFGGYLASDRVPRAYSLQFHGLANAAPAPVIVAPPLQFAGAPNHLSRLVNGSDEDLKQEIVNSGKWTGTKPELDAVCGKQALRIPLLPIRDAVDLVHASIYCTIKALKFSDLPQICGGPIEIAVITSDRRFRWVLHKSWDAAINEV